MNKMSNSGGLFDLAKLNDICKNKIASMSAQEVYSLAVDWAEKYDAELYGLLTRDKDFSVAMFNFDRNPDKPRKDIAKFSEVRNAFSFMFDEIMDKSYEYPENISKEDMKKAAELYIDMYSENDEKDIWFNKMKDLAEKCGFCREVKEYKQNPDAFKGHVGDISSIIRVAVTGRMKSPDLWGILKTLGKEKVIQRLNTFIATL
jgi:glutamyl-tRNA synthetase